MEAIIAVVIVAVLIIFMIILTVAVRYKTCPPDKIMIIYGKLKASSDGTYQSSRCIHGGAAFVWPFFQKYTYMDLTPLAISVDLKNTLSKQNIRIDVPSIFTVGISTDPGIMQNAAERLGMLSLTQISDLARDIIFGQLRLVIATMNIEEINSDRDKFLEAISRNVEGELKKVGLRLINVNVTDISDESGYITALGKEAAAKALEESYSAEQAAEVARAARERATQEADIIVAANIEKQKLEIEAEAIAEQTRRKAQGEADAIFAKMDAEARGLREKLIKQAEGMDALVASAGSAPDAVRLLIADKLEVIVAEQVKAIAGVKIDKVTVWDGAASADGKTATAGFLSGLLKSLPPLEDLYNMAGLSLPDLVAPRKAAESAPAESAPAEVPAEEKDAAKTPEAK